jgi:MFS family permease
MAGGFRAAFAHPDFRNYQAARFLGTVATQMQAVAIGWQIYEITHRAIDLGYVGLAEFLPVFGLSLFAGHVADRFDRLRIVLLTTLGLSLCSLLLLAIAVTGWGGVPAIYAVIFLFGVFRAFSGPASQALVPSLVPEQDFPSAVAWSSTSWQVATIVGPAVSGLVYGVGGAAGVYATTAVATLLAAGALVRVKPRPVPTQNKGASWTTFLAGVRYVWKNQALFGSISLDLFAVLLGGATALLPIYARDILDVGSRGLGFLRSAPSVGAALMAVVLAHRPLKRHAGRIMLANVALFGLATVVFGVSKSFALSLVALFVLGAADMVSVMVRSVIVQIRTPDEMRGRVSAVNSMFVVASNELGEFESGFTAAWFGAVRSVVIGGVGSIAVVLLYAALFPELRDIDRID